MATIDTIGGGNIEPRGLEEEMRSAYLDYAMSVIVGRALPDVRDGLKPVHRRVLHVMNEMGLRPNRQARQVRPDRRRGDGQVPPARRLARSTTRSCGWRRTSRCATRWSTATGTSATSTADSAAAMRYTEARLARLATEMLRDIDQDTVDFAPTYDGTRQEPLVLPARFPNLLVNGSSGIAVGHGDQHPAAQPARGDRRDDRLHRRPDDRRRGADEVHQGPGLPDRGHDPRPRGDPRRLRHRPWPRPRAGARRTSSRSARARRRSSSPSCPTRCARAATAG